MRRQRYCCADCGESLLHARACVDLDHAIPLAVWPGGELVADNLRAVDVGCHALKTRRREARKIARFRASLGARHRVCWLCERDVSPFFFHGCICAACVARIVRDEG